MISLSVFLKELFKGGYACHIETEQDHPEQIPEPAVAGDGVGHFRSCDRVSAYGE